jgi:hypothetical protein
LREVIQLFVKSFDEPVCMENRGKWVDASMAERAAVSVLDLERTEVSEVQVDAKMGESARDMSHEQASRFSYPVLDPPYEVSRTAVDHADPAAFDLAFAAAILAAWSPCQESRGYLIASTYQWPCIDRPCVDMPRLGSTSRGHISICHVFHCHETHIHNT